MIARDRVIGYRGSTRVVTDQERPGLTSRRFHRPIDLAVDPLGKFLYVANNGSSTVAVLKANITAANARTALISTSPTGGGPESIVVVGHP